MTKTQIKNLLKKAANRRKGIGAIPVGLRFTIARVKMFVEAQFDIYNKVHINIIDEKTKKTIVKVDGVVRNKKDQAEKLLKYVAKNAELEDSSLTLYLKNTKKIIDQLSSEVNLYNKTPIKTKVIATKRTTIKPAAKKAAKPPTNKPAAKRTKAKKTYVKLKQTGVSKSKKLDAKRTALKPGKRVSAKGNTYYEYRANRSDLKPRKKGEGESL